MNLEGRTISLRALQPGDYAALYDLVVNKVSTWRNLGQAFPPEQTQTVIWEYVRTLRVVCLRDEPTVCLGMVALMNADLPNGLADLSVVVDPEAPETAGGEAVLLFLHHIFETTAFRKIYAETTDLTIPWLKSGKGTTLPGVLIEGRKIGAILRGGEAHDLYTLTMDREKFLAETDMAYRFAKRDVLPTSGEHPNWQKFLDELTDRFPELVAHRGTAAGGDLLLDDLGIDSLTLVEIVAWLEQRFGGNVSDDDLLHVRSLQELFNLVGADQRLTA